MERNIQPVNNAQGWNGKHKIFEDLISEIKPKIIVEVGSWQGQSTITMAQACNKIGLDTVIYSIDTWLGALEFYTTPTAERDLLLKDGYPQVYYKFIENLKEHGVRDKVKTITLPSNLGLKFLESQGIQADLIYIDGSHEYDDVKKDIELANRLNPKVLFGDDYTNSVFPGVKQAVQEQGQHEVVDSWYWIIRR
ncbi:MAG: class I SAM-dependent methyltransferase [Saprospiraceae bacterium]|nr:class I SAM-dependent methyltransferase [Saprospiraceae bacterium]